MTWTWNEAREIQTRMLAAVAACPSRGPVLSVSQQPECGCAELSECRAGRGRTPGKVSLGDCMECVGPGIEVAFQASQPEPIA